MNRHAIRFLGGFAFIAACGLFVALAGGVEWGTPEAGALAFLTLGFAAAGGMYAKEEL